MTAREIQRESKRASSRRPARKTGRPHLVGLPGGKATRSRRPKAAVKRKSLPAPRGRTGRRRQTERRVGRFVSTLFVPLSRPLSSSGVRFVVTTSAVLMAFIFGLVMLHILSAQASFRLEGLHERVEREEARYRKMRYEVATAESPSRIADAAKSLGMVPPAERRYIVGPSSGSTNGSSDSDDSQPRLARSNREDIKALLSSSAGRTEGR